MGERESALEQQYQDALDQTKRKLQAHEVTIQRLTSSLADKEQQLQVTERDFFYFLVSQDFFSIKSYVFVFRNT